MRLWTLHPCYLDARGLVAVWREGLLAQKVLQGATKGYRHHSQLTRFRGSPDPQAAIAAYLVEILEEARRRAYRFDAAKIAGPCFTGTIDETSGQLQYEWHHLRRKLQRRDAAAYERYRAVSVPASHPLFRIVPGRVREWERER